MGEWLAFTFALTGRREWGYGTQGVALGYELVGLSARAGPQTRLAPQQDSRYEPLTGARFINRPQEVGASPYPRYEPLSGAACAATLAASALKGQPVLSPGQRPGYQRINAYAL